ncbi:MAG: hypothetical protein ACXWB9_02680 [Flavisolibacter sp.]
MKKLLIGSIVGGLIIFIWQFISFAAINFHKPIQQYTDKEEAIMNFLNSQGLEEGGYFLPGMPEGISKEDYEAKMKKVVGKPWASLQYHKELENNMVMNMIRGFLVNVIAVYLFCWLVRRMNRPTFSTIMLSALVLGLIIFLNAPYINYIWFKSHDIWAHLLDYIVSWGLVGAWLGWWLTRGETKTIPVSAFERA